MSALLERTTFETPRALDFFNVVELERQTGQRHSRFAAVVLKELVDNALDACETAAVTPEVRIRLEGDGVNLRIVVADNGPGLLPEVLERILHLDTLTSDKANYRSPTRGLQGNAWKTILGIPYALAGERAAPILVEAHGRRHSISVTVTPANEVRFRHEEPEAPPAPGTRVTVTIPAAGQEINLRAMAHAYRVFNPHAIIRAAAARRATYPRAFVQIARSRRVEHANRRRPSRPEMYESATDWRKWLPTDPTSAHWYSVPDLERLIFGHIAAARRGARDLPLGEFVRQFAGLSRSAKVKAVLAALPGTRHLSDLEAQRDRIPVLLRLMREQERRPPKPEALGIIGKDNLLRGMASVLPVRSGLAWYKSQKGTADGVPFVIEAALAEVDVAAVPDGEAPCRLLVGVNWSPAYGDPFATTHFGWQERGHSRTANGLHDLLAELRADPDPETSNGQVVVAVHLAWPTPIHTDKGKARLELPRPLADALCAAVRGACQVHADLAKRDEKDAEHAARERDRLARGAKATRTTLREAVFDVMATAFAKASGDQRFPVSTRTLYYQVRPLIQEHTDRPLGWNYFSQSLVHEYQEAHGALAGLYREARGKLYEPHHADAGSLPATAGRYAPWAGTVLELGTREVGAYRVPSWRYNKLLLVEKAGLWPVLEAALLGERFDMGIVMSSGYATDAGKDLMRMAAAVGGMTILVLHDCDVDGYNIADVLRRGTRRSPQPIRIVDMGLALAEAQAHGLDAERALRKKALPSELAPRLTDEERRFLGGARRPGQRLWDAQRVELNAFTSDALIAFVEGKLAAHGLAEKVCPPAPVVQQEARRAIAHRVEAAVQREVRGALDLSRIDREVARAASEALQPGALRAGLAEQLASNPPAAWEAILADQVAADTAAVAHAVQAAIVSAAARIAASETGAPSDGRPAV